MNWEHFEALASPTDVGWYVIAQCVRTTASGSHVWYAIRLNGARVSSTRTLLAAKATAEADYAERVKEVSGRRRREPSEYKSICLSDAPAVIEP